MVSTIGNTMDLLAILQVEIFATAFFEEIFRSNTTLHEPVITCYHMFYGSVTTYFSYTCAYTFHLYMTSSPKSGYLRMTNSCGYCYDEIHCAKPYNVTFMAGFGHNTPAIYIERDKMYKYCLLTIHV